MDRDGTLSGSAPVDRVSQPSGPWSTRYGEKHRLHRITEFPAGIAGPQRVRLYRRCDHYILQWWDPQAKRNLSDRVDGDLVAAIHRARQIEDRLEHFRSSGQRSRKVGHNELVQSYLLHLQRRADAEEIDPRTVVRYTSALVRHYLPFVGQPDIDRQYPHVAGVNREFQLALASYLHSVRVLPNGHPNGQCRRMQNPGFVLDVVRSMFAWAGDPDSGALMPEGFRNPFLRQARRANGVIASQFGEPDVTTAMAADFLRECDAYQLRLFAPLVLYGLRAAEPCFLFGEHLGDGWLRVPNIPELAYQTKGRREKRLPLLPCLSTILTPVSAQQPDGLLYLRRGITVGRENPPLVGASLETLVAEFQRRCRVGHGRTAIDRRRTRNQLLHDAGALNYDQVHGEFGKLTKQLKWPRRATLKDFRHLFATCLENAGMPEHYRKFLMGQSPGRAAIVTYTHLNEIQQRFDEAVRRQFQPVIDAVVQRTQDLDLFPPSSSQGTTRTSRGLLTRLEPW